jgi:hydrogenase maturation factor HypF (carbamoyltransferase family)
LEKRKRLAATTQLYIAQGLYGIINKGQGTMNKEQNIFLAGGMSNNKIISEHLTSKGAYTSKKVPRGDAGLSFGQIVCYFLTNSRD